MNDFFASLFCKSNQNSNGYCLNYVDNCETSAIHAIMLNSEYANCDVSETFDYVCKNKPTFVSLRFSSLNNLFNIIHLYKIMMFYYNEINIDSFKKVLCDNKIPLCIEKIHLY